MHRICLHYDISRSTLKRWIKKVRQGKSLENRR
ncbi:MAG: helix-turn-helix domain-containing protein [Candidatus Aphodosoma sp.]